MGILKNALREVLKQTAAEQGREIEFLDSPTRVIETTAQAKYNDIRRVERNYTHGVHNAKHNMAKKAKHLWEINIDNGIDLINDIKEYEAMFPNTYTTLEDIEANLIDKANNPVSGVFGIEVSSEWPDKCYGFEIDRIIGKTTFIKYMGIWKC